MLGRLIKHEWKSMYKMGCLMLGALAVVTFLGWLSFQSLVRGLNGDALDTFGWMDVFGGLTMVLYVMLLVCVSAGTVIYIGVHFYRTMYTDEGYLTHTLPVTRHQILVSKLLVGGLWMMIVLLAIYVSVFLLALSAIFSLEPLDISFAELMDGLGRLVVAMEATLDFDAMRLLARGILISLAGPFLMAATLFGAISLGQLMSRGRLLMGVLFYIIIMVAKQLVTILIQGFASSADMYVSMNLNVGFIVDLIAAAGLYVLSYFVISRKLNLI